MIGTEPVPDSIARGFFRHKATIADHISHRLRISEAPCCFYIGAASAYGDNERRHAIAINKGHACAFQSVASAARGVAPLRVQQFAKIVRDSPTAQVLGSVLNDGIGWRHCSSRVWI